MALHRIHSRDPRSMCSAASVSRQPHRPSVWRQCRGAWRWRSRSRWRSASRWRSPSRWRSRDAAGGSAAVRRGRRRGCRRHGTFDAIVVVLGALERHVDGVLTIIAGKDGIGSQAEVAGGIRAAVAGGHDLTGIGAGATRLARDRPRKRRRGGRTRRRGCGRSRRRRSGWRPGRRACCRSPASSRSHPRPLRLQGRRARRRPAHRSPGARAVERAWTWRCPDRRREERPSSM